VQDPSPAASVTINTTFNNIPLSDGPHVIYVSVTDKAGNISEDQRTIIIDNEAPQVAITAPTGTVGGDVLQISGSVTDNHAVDEYSYQVLDSNKNAIIGTDAVIVKGAVQDGSLGTWDIKGYASGDYYVRILAKDQAGNTTAHPDAGFTIDHTEPLVSVNLTSSATPTASTPVSLQGSVKDHEIVKLLLDDEEIANLTPNVDGNGNWQFVLQEGLVQGKHILSVVASDHFGNASNSTTSPLSAVELTVGPFAVPADGTIAPSLTAALDDPFVIPSNLSVVPSALEDIDQHAGNDVLGVHTKDNPDISQSLKTPAIAATEGGWQLFGMLWYWWLVSIVLLLLASWQVTALAKRRIAAADAL